MRIIKHRVNTIEQLGHLESGLGAEIDLRSRNGKIILAHDPFSEGDDFESYLQSWASKPRDTLILNPKEDGIEKQAILLLEKWGVENFLFLDLAMPTLIRMMRDLKFRKIAVRVSEYEPLEGLVAFEGSIEWAWLDCFSGTPVSIDYANLLARKFKICAVSPELQGYSSERIPAFRALIPALSAVCTKHPDFW